MTVELDYRVSHTEPGKGTDYDKSFSDKKYRKYIWLWEKRVLRHILDKHVHKDPIEYLDFACGTGRIIGFLEPFVSESTGVDVSETMLEVGRKNVVKSRLINADLTKNNAFEGQHFDLITTFRFFLNAQQELRERAIEELAGLLDKKGTLVFNVHMIHTSTLAILIRIYDWLTHRKRKDFNTLKFKEVFSLVKNAGLKVDATYHIGILPIGKEDTDIPIWLINAVESIASKIHPLRFFSRYVIFVCRHAR